MSTVERIEAEILKLSPKELTQLTDWVLALDEQAWDEQIEQDIAAGKLDFLAQEALAEWEAGNLVAQVPKIMALELMYKITP
jgi:hypothetical protein